MKKNESQQKHKKRKKLYLIWNLIKCYKIEYIVIVIVIVISSFYTNHNMLTSIIKKSQAHKQQQFDCNTIVMHQVDNNQIFWKY